jgi:hypothetical protein
MTQFARLSAGCADGFVYGIPRVGDADTWRMIDGKRHIFGGKASKDAFDLGGQSNPAPAAKCRAEEAKGSNSVLQRARRPICRVPNAATRAVR